MHPLPPIEAYIASVAGSPLAEHRQASPGLALVADDTGVTKFGALIGDEGRVGANAVLAPGALLTPGSVVPRTALLDQEH